MKMSSRNAVLLAAVLIILCGCGKRNADPLVSTEKKWFVLVDYKTTKHAWVSFREEGTAYTFKRQYVGKYCNALRDQQVGSRWQLVEVVRKGKNSSYTELEGVRYGFCDRARNGQHEL
jgi:hypothetical protein